MSKPLVVLVERSRRGSGKAVTGRGQPAGFAEALLRRYEVIRVPSGKQAIQTAHERRPHVIVLDALSMKTTGERIARAIKEAVPTIPLIHLPYQAGPELDSPAEIVLREEFTWRKLINAIERLTQTPVDEQIIACGPFWMDAARRVLMVNGQEYQLTPKLALLVEEFFRHPGEVLNRKTLMERVWQTDYLGDTRTLNVHIRWIRQWIETDPSNPVYLKTVRGIGYRLDVDAADEREAVLQLVAP